MKGSLVNRADTAPPLELNYASPPPERPTRLLALFGIAAVATVAGGIIGAITNAINGFVSPTYFVNVMGWQYVSHVWLASVLQGVLEGLVVGLLFAVILATTIGIVTGATCDFAFGLQWLGKIVLSIFGSWILGGICGIILAESNPVFFQSTFIGVPNDPVQMLRYSWVGGSIWGAEFGGFGVIVIGLILFRLSWQRLRKQETR